MISLYVTVGIVLALLCTIVGVVLARSILLGPQKFGRYTLHYKDLPGAFGLGFVSGPFVFVVHALWWTWRLEWTGEFRDHWPGTRPVKKGEIPDGALYELTKHRGLNPHVKAAKRDKYHYLNTEQKEKPGWLARLRQSLRR